jgi:hypothetical protein
MERSVISVVSLHEQDEEVKRYWRGKSPHERLRAIEETRQMIYGYDPASTRLQRVLEVVHLA